MTADVGLSCARLLMRWAVSRCWLYRAGSAAWSERNWRKKVSTAAGSGLSPGEMFAIWCGDTDNEVIVDGQDHFALEF